MSRGQPPEDAVRVYLDLSTAHIPTTNLASGNLFADYRGLRWGPHAYGFTVFLGGSEADEDVPLWFLPILYLARSVNAGMVNFDSDGPVVEMPSDLELLAQCAEENEK